MKTVIYLIYGLLILCIVYRFFVLLTKMKQPIIYPVREEEQSSLRVYPQNIIQSPRPNQQKAGIVLYLLMILYLVAVIILEYYFKSISWPLLFLAFVPYFQLQQVFNMFAVVEGGILCVGRFIHWQSIKVYEWTEINQNHRFYGYGEEVNHGYELRFKLKPLYFPAYVVVTDKKVKQRLTELLDQQMETNN